MAEFFRDMQVSMDVGKMVELGKFDKEFTAYGCAYLQNGEVYIPVSEHAETIYRIREKKQLEGIYPSNVVDYHITTKVPAGAIDDIWEEVKWSLGEQLLNAFPKQYLDILNTIGNLPPEDNMHLVLEDLKTRIEGLFAKDILALFDAIVVECYLSKQLDNKHFKELKSWSDNIWRQMEDDPEIKDIHSRTLNGFAYLENEKIKYKVNAQYVHVVKSRQILRSQGILTTPIYSEMCWYSTQSQFPAKRQAYDKKLKEFMEVTMEIMCYLEKQKSFSGRKEFLEEYEKVKDLNNELVTGTFQFYGYQWHCF